MSVVSFADDFTLDQVDVGEASLRVRHGGTGPAVVLVHGHPRTHWTWERVAPLLAERRTVVCPDVRGYGRSRGPSVEAPGHASFSKRAAAADVVALMRHLGHERFSVVGHDRGSDVAFRLAMDSPDVVDRLVVADAMPIGEALARADATFAAAWWHWWFLGNDSPSVERVINADPDAWYRLDDKRQQMSEAAWQDLRDAVHDPAVVHGMCEDYRAGLTVDRAHDDADRTAGRRVRPPTLLLWSLRDDLEELYGDPLGIWREHWADDVRGHGIDSGHHMAEEAPEDVARSIEEFLSDRTVVGASPP